MAVRFRDHYFMRERTIADTDTVIVPLDLKDPISYLKIEVEATNGVTSCIDWEVADDVDRLEVIDGSRVIQSLSGIDWLGQNAYHLGRIPRAALSEVGGRVQESTFYIPFGRYLDDLELYFNPALYRNPQLRVAISLTISPTVGFATGSGRITVMARVIEEGAKAYRGFLMNKYVEEFVSGASGDRRVELYSDYPYRMLLVRALLTTRRPDECLTRWRLSCDGDAEVPFDIFSEDLVDANHEWFGMFDQTKELLAADGNTSLFDLYDIRQAFPVLLPRDLVIGTNAIAGERVSMSLMRGHTAAASVTGLEADPVTRIIGYAVRGLAPSAILAYPFKVEDEPDGYFDSTKYGSVNLFLTQGAVASCAVMLQQHVR